MMDSHKLASIYHINTLETSSPAVHMESHCKTSGVTSCERVSRSQSERENFVNSVNREIRNWMNQDDNAKSAFLVKYRGGAYSFTPIFQEDGEYQLWLGSGEGNEGEDRLIASNANDDYKDFCECGWFVYNSLFGQNKTSD